MIATWTITDTIIVLGLWLLGAGFILWGLLTSPAADERWSEEDESDSPVSRPPLVPDATTSEGQE